MIGAFILVILLFGVTLPLLQMFKKKLPWFDTELMIKLYWYHIFFACVYYITVMGGRSDSFGYFRRPQYEYSDWLSIYTTGTRFIDFVGYPFINYLKFTYEMMMILFSWLGYWGFVYFYIFFKENIVYKHKLQGIDLITLFIFLPNMHFWTASLGKGSIIFMGLAMATYGLSRLKTRKPAIIIGMLIIYHVRPHVFLFMLVGILVGMFTGKQKVPAYQKFLIFGGAALSLILMYDQILAFVGLDADNLIESFDQFSNKRSFELSKSNSGIDISKYPLIFKLFTFWFRPLFVDAPNAIGLIVSVENLLYLYLTLKLFTRGFLKFVKKSSALIKMSLVIFLATSFALGETMSNMGIIIRQKSQVMYFLLFVIVAFLDYKKALFMKRKLSSKRNVQPQPPLQSFNPSL